MSRAFVILLMTAFGAAQAAFDTGDWSWHAPLSTPGAAKGFVRAALPPEILDSSLPSLDDLRVIDEAGELVPHLVRRERVREEHRVEWRDVRLVNQTFLPDNHTRVTLYFGAATSKNRIAVSLSESNYRRRVSLEGSENGEHWEIVAEDLYLFDISLPDHQFKVDTLEFPANDFRYLRLTIFNMADDPRQVKVMAARACFWQKLEARRVPVPVVALTGPIPDPKHRYNSYEMDLGFRNLPVTALRFQIRDPLFYRGFELLGRNTLTEEVRQITETGPATEFRETPWRPITSGVLYRTREADKVSESLEIQGLNAPYRHLQLRTFDKEDPPVSVEGVEPSREYLSIVFDFNPEHAYTLIGGNPKARAAQFDLAHALPGLDKSDLPPAQIGAAAAFDRKPSLPPWTERHGGLIWAALILAAGLMVVLIVKGLRTPRPA